MNGAAKWLVFRVPGFLVASLAILWVLGLFLFRLDGRDTTEWQAKWPWAVGMLFGGCFWAAVPAGFEKEPSAPPR